jgi:alanine racemase
MDYIILESTKDEVCIFNDALSAGKQLKTISYELMTQLHGDIERIVI